MRVMLLSKIEFQLKTRSFGMTFAAIVDRYVRTVTTREFPTALSLSQSYLNRKRR